MASCGLGWGCDHHQRPCKPCPDPEGGGRAAWTGLTFAGGACSPSWLGEKQEEGEGWTFRTAAENSPQQLFGWLDEAQRITERVVGEASTLDALAQEMPWGEPISLRWVLLHLVQEYGRHLGHADLIREAIDGTVGV